MFYYYPEWSWGNDKDTLEHPSGQNWYLWDDYHDTWVTSAAQDDTWNNGILE